MDKEKMKFWVTCPDCKKKFGVNPMIIMKYMDRLFKDLKKFKVRKTKQ